jgi:hypothetical protein
MTARLFAFDYETHLIGPDKCGCGEVHGQFPPAVCMTWADDAERSGICTPADGADMLVDALEDEECTIIGAETAFDVLVSCYNNGDFDEWLHQWIQAYKAGRVRDVLVRQRLLNLAAGRFEFHTFSNGNRVRTSNDLAGAARDCCGLHLDKSADTFRLRYSELDGVPFAKWPREAIEYAQLDPEATGMVFDAQENWREHRLFEHIPELWSGHKIMPNGDEPDPLAIEHAENCHALWLKVMSGHVGVMIDEFALDQYEGRVLLEYQDLCVTNRRAGLLRREYWRDQKKMRELGSEFAGRLRWAELKAALDVDDPDALECWSELKAEGLVRWSHKRNTKVAASTMYSIYVEAGKEPPRTDGYEKKLKAYLDSEGPEPAEAEGIALDADACRLAGLLEIELDIEPKMQGYADLVHASKIINTDIPKIRPGIERPLHTHFTTIIASDRTSSANPPLHNRDRGKEEEAGDRECFIPTMRGWCYIDIDFAQLELYCLAQACKWHLGYSSMGEALLLEKDLHLDLAADILTEWNGRPHTYEELDALKGDAKKYYKKARQASKGGNFGFPGGLGSNTMVGYAAKSYGVYLPKDGWDKIKGIWKNKWHEMPDYFGFINSCESYEGSGEFLCPSAPSGFLRAAARYTAACNHHYQHLGAVVAKLAGWYLFLACYERGVDPILYGSGSAGGLRSTQCRPGHFIHDQFLNQIREDRVQVALPRVEHWCRLAAIETLPDYGHVLAKRTTALAARRWSKEAERLETKTGKIEIWEDARLFAGGES